MIGHIQVVRRVALVATLLVGAVQRTHAQSLRVRGLRAPVTMARDSAGIVHITARNEHDLFFAQGYNSARDRLFQLELWRRQATGTMAEVLGPRWIARDRASRLLRYRGPMAAELQHYHPRGTAIVTAFVDGINAYVARVARDSSLLPPELRWLGITPGRWTPSVVISRHNALAANARDEVTTARAVRAIGDDAVVRRRRFEPAPARVAIDSAITQALDAGSDDALLAVYDAFKNAPQFRPDDVQSTVRRRASDKSDGEIPFGMFPPALDDTEDVRQRDHGTTAGAADRWESNNWVIAGSRTASGRPMLANDPHRTITTPSLRYLIHLTAPGWDVIGGGEPAIPGVAIGHNAHGAWGLTIFGLDVEDLYTYETSAADARSYRYNGVAATMRVEYDTIRVRGAPPVPVTLRFTRHGPVLFEDSTRHVAVALRAAWFEPGGAPYLASLRIDQARTWSEFRKAVAYAHMPALNWLWADTSGAIGWQSAGIAPIRKRWDGLVPVPGDGRFEWSGFLSAAEMPHEFRPASGYVATANALNVPRDYAHVDAIARTWAEPWRLRRLTEVLDTLRLADVPMMQRLQHDELPVAARALVALLRSAPLHGTPANAARDSLLAWNGVLSPQSVGAAIYATWERTLSAAVAAATLPPRVRPILRTVPLSRVVEWLTNADSVLGTTPVRTRDSLVSKSFDEAIVALTAKLGPDMARWQYGQALFHHVRIAHLLDGAVTDSLRQWLSPGPIARGGYANTVNATGNADNQTAGASLRVVFDLANWDRAMATNTPGQSGDPRSPHYRDLFAPWAQGRYYLLPFSRAAVQQRTETIEYLRP